MENSRRQLLRWIDCLLNPASTYAERRQAGQDWCGWGLGVLGIDHNAGESTPTAFSRDTILPTGKAISPLGAARCVWEFERTAVLLRGMADALRLAFARFPGETIHVLEAGCGPLAPLALPFALRYPASRVQFTLLDLHPAALDGARRIADALGVAASVRGCIAADATSIRLPPAERPHIIACEVLLRALTREPQVAATCNLAPQVRPGGFFLPERIDVDACLFNSGVYYAPQPEPFDLGALRAASVMELGPVFRLEAEAVGRLRAIGPGKFAAAAVTVPPHRTPRWRLGLFTRIKVFREHVLRDFESSLNQPLMVKDHGLGEDGGTVRFVYDVSHDPGLRVVV